MIYNQSDFSGGQNFFTSDLNIPQNGYQYLINSRQRLGHIEANNKALKIALPPTAGPGKLQGHISLGDILIEFIDGLAWYQISGSTDWIQVPAFKMDATVDKLWSQAVPASTFNLTRKLNPSGNANDPILKGKYFAINGTDAGIVVQDTINQPFLIYQDITSGVLVSRVIGNYPDSSNPLPTDWTPQNPEYVPVGAQMMFIEGKLYIVSADGSEMFQSVSGMPLNFVINIDVNGNAAGDATTTSIAFDNDEITCVVPTSTQDSFIYGTTHNTRIVTFNFTNTVFGEPTYSTTVVPIGPVNQDCVMDILGDTAIMDSEGVKSLNAVQQQKWRGNNSIFSLSLSRLLTVVTGGTVFIKQTRCRCVSFNNFGIFALDTKWGYLFAIYDMLTTTWVALDIIPGLVGIIQFTILETQNADYLYAQTQNNQLFQLYADVNNREMASVHTRVFAKVRPQVVSDAYQALPQLMVEQKSERLNLLFQDGSEDTNVTVQEFVDGKITQLRTEELQANIAGVGPGPIFPPVIPSTVVRSQPLQFNLTEKSINGTKIAFVIQWSSDAKLQALELITADKIPPAGNKQTEQALIWSQFDSSAKYPKS